MKIVQLIYSLSSGGAERFVVDLSNELARQGHEVHLVIFRSGEGSEFYRFLIDESVVFHNMNIKKGFGVSPVFKVMNELREINPDVVHAHLNVVPYLYIFSLMNKCIKVIHTLHNIASRTVGSLFQVRINQFMYKRNIIQPVAISDVCADSFRSFYGIESIEVIDNGRSPVVAGDEYSCASEQINSFLQGSKKPVFVHVARFHPQKNQDLLISSFNKLHDEGVGFLLLVIGSGYDRPGEAQILRDKACTSIKFLGEKRNVGDYLLLADAFCLSSHYEGLPISLLEALSAGCVPICTAVGGIPDVITDGVTGYLSIDCDIESYCRAIRRYLSSPNSIDKTSLQSFFNKHYSIEQCALSYISLYNGQR